MRRVLVARCIVPNMILRVATSKSSDKHFETCICMAGEVHVLYTVLLRIVLLGSADNKSCLSSMQETH